MTMTTPMRETLVPPATLSPGSKPPKSRYLLVVLLPLVALFTVVAWGFTSSWAASDMSQAWDRADVPGQLVLELHPGTWYIYQEATLSAPTFRVLGPGGTPVVVEPASGGDYTNGGSGGSLAARFEVPPGVTTGGQYTIVADSRDVQGEFAVTDVDVAGRQRVEQIAQWILLAVNVGAAIAIAVVPIVRSRRLAK